MNTDRRALQLAEARYRNGYGTTAANAWDTLDPALRQHLVEEATHWLRAAVEAGLIPSAERPTDNHDAVYIDDEGLLYAEYRTTPVSDAILRLVWAGEMAESKADLEEQGATFRLIGWST